MRKSYTLYYSLLSIISLAAVLHTVLVGSFYVQHGKQYRNLTVEKNNLEAQKQTLQLQLAKAQNLESIKDFVLAENFESIANVEYLHTSSALASR